MPPLRSAREHFTETLHHEVAVLQAQHPALADGLSRACALLEDGRLFPEDDGRSAMVQASDGESWYAVNGACTCPASTYRQEPCKHRLAWRLYQHVGDRLADAQEERWTVTQDQSDTAPSLKPEWLVQVQGRPFIRFEGLLELAHARALVALETTVVSVSLDQAVCQATARFDNGRTFTDIGDASPDNVAKHLRPHFIRMAATRASARALRRALNISACSIEELGEAAAA